MTPNKIRKCKDENQASCEYCPFDACEIMSDETIECQKYGVTCYFEQYYKFLEQLADDSLDEFTNGELREFRRVIAEIINSFDKEEAKRKEKSD